MNRYPIAVRDVQPEDLIIATDNTRVRVSSTLTNTAREIVIIYGRSARGDVGIPHHINAEVTRLV